MSFVQAEELILHRSIADLMPKEPFSLDHRHLAGLFSEIHCGGYLWALITLKDILPPPLQMIARLANDYCQKVSCIVLPVMWNKNLCVRPDAEFESLPPAEWGANRYAVNELLTILNALLKDNALKMNQRKSDYNPLFRILLDLQNLIQEDAARELRVVKY